MARRRLTIRVALLPADAPRRPPGSAFGIRGRPPAAAALEPPREIVPQVRVVDAQRRARSVGRSQDRKPSVPRGVTGDEQARRFLRLVLVRPWNAPLGDLAAKHSRQARSLALIGGKELGTTWNDTASREANVKASLIGSDQLDNRILAKPNPVAGEAIAIVARDAALPIGAQEDVSTPEGQLEREVDPMPAPAEDGDGTVPHLPSVADRAGEYGTSEAFPHPGHVRDDVGDPRCDEELAAGQPLARLEAKVESELIAGPVDHGESLTSTVG